VLLEKEYSLLDSLQAYGVKEDYLKLLKDKHSSLTVWLNAKLQVLSHVYLKTAQNCKCGQTCGG
jgi:hypothetical protein